jgi:hypothetical protein
MDKLLPSRCPVPPLAVEHGLLVRERDGSSYRRVAAA